MYALPPHDQRCRFRPLAGRACALLPGPRRPQSPPRGLYAPAGGGAELGPVRVYPLLYAGLPSAGRDATLYVRQAGRYLTLFHTGGYGTVAEGYRRVLDHAAARGLALRGPFFEDPLLDELSVRGYENYALLLSVGISGAERASSA